MVLGALPFHSPADACSLFRRPSPGDGRDARRRHRLSSASTASRDRDEASATSQPQSGGLAWPSWSAIGRHEEHGEREGQPDGDGRDEQPVGRPAERAGPTGRAAAGEGVGGLGEHHGHERRAGRGRERRARRGTASPGRHPAATKRDDEGAPSEQRRLGRAEDAEGPAEDGAVEQPARHGRAGRARGGRGGSAPRATAESVSVPMSRARICSTPSASGNRPPDSAQTTNGRELGDVVGEVVGEEPADVDERRPALLDAGDDAWRSGRRAARGRPPPGRRRCPSAPMAMPMSASCRAGPSLTPSPVIATTWPRARSARAMRSLSSGETRATTTPSWSSRAPRTLRRRPGGRRRSGPGRPGGAARPRWRWRRRSPGGRR